LGVDVRFGGNCRWKRICVLEEPGIVEGGRGELVVKHFYCFQKLIVNRATFLQGTLKRSCATLCPTKTPPSGRPTKNMDDILLILTSFLLDYAAWIIVLIKLCSR
jgi:hypothetical protein